MNSLKANYSVMELEGRLLNGLMLSCATDNKESWLMVLNQTGLTPCEKKPAFLQLLRSFKSFAKAVEKPAVLAPAYLL